jgi:hypothetical protein
MEKKPNSFHFFRPISFSSLFPPIIERGCAVHVTCKRKNGTNSLVATLK